MSDEKVDFEEEEDETSTEVVIVKLGINVGDKFRSFNDLHRKLTEAARANFVRFSKRDSRTIEAAKRKIKRHLRPELEFYQLKYSCFFSQKNRPKGTGKRKRKSLAREFEVSCPASISLRATEDGNFLEVYAVTEVHNHPVSESEYQRIMSKKRSSLDYMFGNMDEPQNFDDLDEDDKYKTVLKKCRHIAKLASVSNGSRVQEIIKNLNDFIFYLKFTTSHEDMMKLAEIKQENNNILSDKDVLDDEKIQIIVENENAM